MKPVFESLGTFWGAIERDIQDPSTPPQYRRQLRRHKRECIEIILRKLDSDLRP